MPEEVCLALNISKRSLQGYREYGIIPYSCIGGKYMYKESDLAKILIQKKDNIWTE
ncbi:MAG: helix-turn-helix domain-containing protein [Bacteroides stercoris]